MNGWHMVSEEGITWMGDGKEDKRVSSISITGGYNMGGYHIGTPGPLMGE